MGLGRAPPAAAGGRRRLHRRAGDWILRRARGAAPLRRGPHRGRRRADLGPPGRARPVPQPGGAVSGGHRSRAHRLPAGHRARQRRRLRLRGAHHRGSAAALQRPAGAAGARARRSSGPTTGAAGSRPGWCCWRWRLALSLTTGPLERFAVLGGLLWLAVRAPVGGALNLQPLFSPATFFRPLLGPLSGSAGRARPRGHPAHHRRASGSGAAGCPAAGTAWRSGRRCCWRRPTSSAASGRGITPPAGGVSVGLWLSWQLAILVSARRPSSSRPRRCSAARGPDDPSARRIVAGVAHRVRGRDGRRAGLEPAGRLARLVHLPLDAGAVAGDAPRAPLGDDQRHRAGCRQLRGAGDLGRGARRKDPGGAARHRAAGRGARPARRAAAGAVRRAGARRAGSRRPASEMYALWHGSALGDQGYPAHLALWSAAGDPARRAAARLARSAAVAALHDGARAGRRTIRSGSRSSPGCPACTTSSWPGYATTRS